MKCVEHTHALTKTKYSCSIHRFQLHPLWIWQWFLAVEISWSDRECFYFWNSFPLKHCLELHLIFTKSSQKICRHCRLPCVSLISSIVRLLIDLTDDIRHCQFLSWEGLQAPKSFLVPSPLFDLVSHMAWVGTILVDWVNEVQMKYNAMKILRCRKTCTLVFYGWVRFLDLLASNRLAHEWSTNAACEWRRLASQSTTQTRLQRIGTTG